LKQISAFDLDHTLVFSNSGMLFYRSLISRGYFSSFSILKAFSYAMRHSFCGLSLSALHGKVFNQLLKGEDLKFFEEEVAHFLATNFHEFLYSPALTRLRRAQHEGHYTVILSAGPSFLVGPIANYLGVNEWYASKYKVDAKGIFESIQSLVSGEEKAVYIKELIKKLKTVEERVTAYSDSHLDLPFLKSAGTPIAVNPNRKLLKISKAFSWEIL